MTQSAWCYEQAGWSYVSALRWCTATVQFKCCSSLLPLGGSLKHAQQSEVQAALTYDGAVVGPPALLCHRAHGCCSCVRLSVKMNSDCPVQHQLFLYNSSSWSNLFSLATFGLKLTYNLRIVSSPRATLSGELKPNLVKCLKSFTQCGINRDRNIHN